MKVDIVIAGSQKCGTSALHSFLGKHPKIISSNPKELDFFNSEIKFNRGISYYHSFFQTQPFFAKWRGYKYMESSPSYVAFLLCEQTSQRMFEYNKNMKVIILVRNPIDRAYSAWKMYKKRNEIGDKDWWIRYVMERKGKLPENLIRRTSEEYGNFQLFVKNEIKALEQGSPIENSILMQGKYYNGIYSFQKKFKQNVFVIKNEDLDNNTSIELSKISFFLELEDFNWKIFDGVKVFKGNYSEKPDDSSLDLLNGFYNESDKKLKELTGINYF